MSMSVDITELAEYKAAVPVYRTRKQQAEEQGDAAEQARVEAWWAEQKSSFTTLAYQRRDAEQARTAALNDAKARFPRVPEGVYAHLTDPAQIVAVAEQTSKSIDEAAPPTPAPGTPQWPAPPATGAGQAPPPRSPLEVQQELVPEVRRGKLGVHANEAFRRSIFADQIGSRFDHNAPPR